MTDWIPRKDASDALDRYRRRSWSRVSAFRRALDLAAARRNASTPSSSQITSDASKPPSRNAGPDRPMPRTRTTRRRVRPVHLRARDGDGAEPRAEEEGEERDAMAVRRERIRADAGRVRRASRPHAPRARIRLAWRPGRRGELI